MSDFSCIGGCGRTKSFESFPYPEHPNWGYLCSGCANEAPKRGSRNSKGIVEEKPLDNGQASVAQ